MESRRKELNSQKGDGSLYVKKALEAEAQMTPEEKAEEDAWWEEFSKDFKIIEEEQDK